MLKRKNTSNIEKLFDSDRLRRNLIVSSLFITAFEMLKDSVVFRIRDFYTSEFDKEGRATVSPAYNERVLSRHKHVLLASLAWLKEAGAIDEQDCVRISEARELRDKIAHELPEMLIEIRLDEAKVLVCFSLIVEVLRKIEVWWIKNVEIPTDPDWDGVTSPNEDEILPGPVCILSMLREIALSNGLG